MRKTVERELKLTPPDAFVLPELAGESLPTRSFVSTYYDTPDLRLARHGVTFRHRQEDGVGRWQLKLPRGDARLELEQEGRQPRLPEELVSLVRAYTRDAPLERVARLRTHRDVVRVSGAEVVDDTVSLLEERRIARRFRELEVELIDGSEADLRRLGKALKAAGATADGWQPKLFRALDLQPPTQSVPTRRTPPREALAMRLAEEYRRLLAHDPGARLGDDPEDVHQLRVAARRLRAYLRVARPLFAPGSVDELRSELSWLGGALGPARDLDILLERLRAETSSLDVDADAGAELVADVEQLRALAYATALDALTDVRYFALLDRLDETAQAPPLSQQNISLAELFAKELRRTERVFVALDDGSPDEALHAARIRLKRVRYAAELAAHELGTKGESFLRAAKALQDVLGEHQDGAVAESRIRAWAETHPNGAVAAGRLIEREHARRDAMRAAWPKRWRKLEQAGPSV